MRRTVPPSTYCVPVSDDAREAFRKHQSGQTLSLSESGVVMGVSKGRAQELEENAIAKLRKAACADPLIREALMEMGDCAWL